MNSSAPQGQDVRKGIGLGIAAVFAIVLVAALALGADAWIAILAGVFVGIFVGGGIGFLIAARAATPD